MSLGNRDASLRHGTGAVQDSGMFAPGTRVVTVEGLLGTVEAVNDGPFGADSYEVVLDGGLGGGTYRQAELTSESTVVKGELHVASDDYPELAEILVERPPLEHAQRVASLGGLPVYEAGLGDWLDKHVKDDNKYKPGNNYSVDWCRFRKNEHCFFPRKLDEKGTKEAGYDVWVPEDRGYCPREAWKMQKACPVSEPGPHSREKEVLPDATKSWEDGGQRKPFHGSVESTRVAAWADIVAKAKSIRAEGGVRITTVPDSSNPYIVAEVLGYNGIYQARLMLGKTGSIDMWSCGCKWNQYVWGRSPQWKKYEGRLCSHALALQYEAQARGMFGKAITPDTDFGPDQDWQYGSWGNNSMTSPAERDPNITTHGALQPFDVRFNGGIVQVVDIAPGMVIFADGSQAEIRDVDYPDWDPRIGLTAAIKGQDHPGAMVALLPSTAVAVAMCDAVPGDEKEDLDQLHVTLAYIPGADDDIVSKIKSVTSAWAKAWHPMVGAVGGWGQFHNSDGNVLYAAMDIPGLEHAREDLVDRLSAEGVEIATNHGFTPHMTLKYSDTPLSVPEGLPEGVDDMLVTTVVVARGTDWTYYPLGVMDFNGSLHDEPEAALPSTDGEIQDGDPSVRSTESIGKTAARVFSPAEQRAMIQEGAGTVASNLDRLDIAGTHYEMLDGFGDDDTDWMF